MKKLYENITIIFSIIGTLMMVAATGAIEGNEFIAAGTLTILGISMFVLALISQEKEKQQ
jgi:hypothetical protein|tara:strand:- start:1117 stop:1296 length:180 start_codon:yes stop_codon:yes gene_type:complete